MAGRFWVGGAGTWDASDTTHWASSSGGAGGQTVPGSADAVTIDAASGAGTITVNTNAIILSLTCGAMGMTLDFSVNNNNLTCSSTGGLSITGTGTRTIKLGSGIFTLSGISGIGAAITPWNAGVITGLTFDAGTSTIKLTGNSVGARTFAGGGLTYGSVVFDNNTSGGLLSTSGTNVYGTLTINSGQNVTMTAGGTTATNFSINGTATNPSFLGASSTTSPAPLSVASGSPAMTYAAINRVTFTGGATFAATNSIDLGGNTGITITPPGGGGLLVNPGMRGGMI